MSEDAKQKFYKALNTIVSTERIDNEEAYIINDYVSNLEVGIKEKQQKIERLKGVYGNNLELVDKMYVKDKEIEFHKNNERIAIDCQNKLNEEIERLNNIINELEKYLNEQIQKSWEIEEQCYEDIESKLQELKGDGSNE